MIHQVLLLLLVCAGLWSFYTTIQRRLRLDTVKDRTLPLDNIGWRILRILDEVLIQSRVIKNRPFVGMMHALVMWGFMAFGWVSLQHLWIGFTGLTHAPHESWYRTFAAYWAVAVLLGIGSLAFRRFILRPKALGHLSPTSGIVAGLITSLMGTYLLDWLEYFAFGSVAWQANWWLHTLALLAFLHVIPRSKHLHLVLAPVAIFFRSETTSAMRPLDNEDKELGLPKPNTTEDDFGLVKFEHVKLKDVIDINACVECGRCTDVCPANLSGHTLNPKEVILQMQNGYAAKGELVAGTAGEIAEKKAWVSEKDLFQCLSCGACEQACPVGIEHVGSKFLDLRRGLVSESRTNNDRLDTVIEKMMKAPHNPWGFSHSMREKFVEETKLPIFDGQQEWLFWLGCGNSYDPHGQKVAKDMKQIMDAAGISWGVLEQETCCGEPARRLGVEWLYLDMAKKLIGRLKQFKVKNIVTCCPHCLTMLDKDYRQLPAYAELNIRVLHHSELIVRYLPKLNLTPKKRTIAYHDPCNLARGRNQTSDPRKILRACGSELTEMKHSHEKTNCCGGGGGQIHIQDDTVNTGLPDTSQRRVAEFNETKAEVLALACSYCYTMLEKSGKGMDIAEIVAECLQAKP